MCDTAELKVAKGKDYVMGCGPTMVEPGQEAEISVESGCSFHPERVIIPADIADAFTILDLIIDGLFQIRDGRPIPAVRFAHDATDNRLWMTPICAHGFVKIRVLNRSKERREFVMALVGPAKDR